MIPFKILWILLLVTFCGARLSSTHASGGFDNVDELVNSMTNGVIHLLENLQNSHGETLGNVLTLLLERVRQYNVTEDEANIIRDAIALVDDPKAKEILDIVGKVNTLFSPTVVSDIANIPLSFSLVESSICPSLGQIVPQRPK